MRRQTTYQLENQVYLPGIRPYELLIQLWSLYGTLLFLVPSYIAYPRKFGKLTKHVGWGGRRCPEAVAILTLVVIGAQA